MASPPPRPGFMFGSSVASQAQPRNANVLFGDTSQGQSRHSSDAQRRLTFTTSLAGILLAPLRHFSDFTIILGESRYRVHRVILTAHSGYFKRLLYSGFREAGEREITLHDDPQSAVAAVVQYFYRFSYDSTTANALLHHSTVFTLADKYDIPGLKDLAVEKFAESSRLPAFDFSDGKTRVLIARALVAAASHVYAHTPPADDRLRKAVIQTFIKDDKRIYRACEKAAFDEMLQEVPELACDLMPALTGIEMRERGGEA